MLENFIESIVLASQFRAKLYAREQASPNAAAQGKDECCHSGNCCWRRPGCLAPEDVPRIAAFLGVTELELAKRYLVVDEIAGKLVLLPGRAHQMAAGLTGGKLSWRETHSLASPCGFLDEHNKCSIHEVKPQQCREFRCWEQCEVDIIPFEEGQLRALGFNASDPDEYDGCEDWLAVDE